MIKPVSRKEGKRWQVYGRRNGRKVYLGTYDSPRLAQAADEDHRTQQRKIAAGELPPETDSRRTLGSALTAWLAWLEAAGSRSLVPYRSRVETHVRPALGDVPLVKVTARQLERLAADLTARVSRSTIDGVLAMLGSAWGWFARQGYVGRGANPVRAVDLDGLPKRLKHAVSWISDPRDITRLLAACSPTIRTLVHLLIGTGLRIDEALHLRWDDVDLERRTITVRRGRQGTPKSGRARTVEIFDVVLPMLREMRLAAGGNVLLWPSSRHGPKDAERVRTESGVHRAFKSALSAAGMPTTLRVHDLRHTFAGMYLTNGGDIYRLSQLLGHSSVKVTEQTYAHLARHAFEQDRARVSFEVPGEARSADVLPFSRRR